MSDAQLRVEIQMLADQAASKINQLQEQINGLQTTNKKSELGQQFQRSGDQITAVGKQVTSTIFSMGAGILRTASNFQSSMNQVSAVTGASNEDLQKLRNQAKQLGSETKFSATQAAEAMGFLGMAGFRTRQIMQSMPTVLNLASASNVDLGRTADIASDIMGGFQLKAEDMSRIANVLAQTSVKANTGVEGLGQAFKFVAPVANSFGMSIEETSAVLGSLANVGIKSGMGGTVLRGALNRLTKPTKKITSALNKLGIKVRGNDGEMRSFTAIMKEIAASSAKGAEVLKLFGTEAGSGMQALVDGIRAGTVNLENFTKANQEAEKNNALGKMVEKMSKGLNPALDGLGSAFEALQIAIAESGLIDNVTMIVNKLAELVRFVAKANPELLRIGVIIGAIAFGVGALLIPLGMLISLMGTIITFQAAGGLVAFGAAMKGAAVGAWALVSPLVILVAKFTAIIAVGVALGVALNVIAGKLLQLVGAVAQVAAGVIRWMARIMTKVEEVLGIPAIFSTALSEAASVIDSFGQRMYQAGARLVNQVAEGIKSAVGSITEAWNWVTSKLSFSMPKSDAKRGNLSNLTSWGKAIPETIAKGMMNASYAMPMAMNSLTSPSVLSPPESAIASNNTNVDSPVNVTINLNGNGDQSMLEMLRAEGDEIARIVKDSMQSRERTRYV